MKGVGDGSADGGAWIRGHQRGFTNHTLRSRQSAVPKADAAAQEAAEKVLSTGDEQHLRPMNSFERRAVHTQLANESEIVTESEGDGIDRHIVIRKR